MSGYLSELLVSAVHAEAVAALDELISLKGAWRRGGRTPWDSEKGVEVCEAALRGIANMTDSHATEDEA